MTSPQPNPVRLRRSRAVLAGLGAMALVVGMTTPADSQEFRAIVGSGSTWSANMVEQWTADIKQDGVSVSFSATGSSTGRKEFYAGTVDFAVSEIPYGLTDASGGLDVPPSRGFAYLPIVAGGTAFMYNLKVAGKRVTNLRLSGEVTAKIFTGAITSWDDPAIAADNPNIALPARKIVPVVRSDGSGTSAQFTEWMSKEYGGVWNDFCRKQGIPFRGSCPFTSNYPSAGGFVSQSGSLGVAGYVATPTAEGAITYVEYSYALRAKYPVAKILNSSGYYIEPNDQAVAVGLMGAAINNDASNKNTYLTQVLDGVYRNADTRSYPLSSYSYAVIPTAEGGTFKVDKGKSLGKFLYYSICEGQQAAKILGYSPLPQNLVQAGLEQIRLIPGTDLASATLSGCNNPTFSADGTNTVAKNAPQPPACDKAGPTQCATGTAGAKNVATAVTKGTGAPGGVAAGGAKAGAGVAGAAGATPGATASAGTPAAGANGAVAGADGAGADVAGAAGLIDPETGEVLSAGEADGSAAPVSAIAVSAPGDTGSAVQTWLMILAAMSLLIATVGPPALQQRLGKGDA